MEKLKKCPCGKFPQKLHTIQGETAKWGYASGDCCDDWNVEFRTVNYDFSSKESYKSAVGYWNNAPREGEKL